MSGLRLALLIIGLMIVLIVALVSYDKFRLRKILDRRSLLQGNSSNPWREPVLAYQSELDFNPPPPTDTDKSVVVPEDDETAGDEQPSSELDDELEELERVAKKALDLDPGLPAGLREQHPDGVVDFVARIHGKNVVSHNSVLGLYKQHEYLLEKDHKIYGYNVDKGVWRNLEMEPDNAKYSDLELSLLLSDNDGAVGESELNKLAQLGLRVAEAVSRPIKFSMTFEEAQAKAEKLDEFCRTYDVLAIINVLARGQEGFAGRDIERAVEEQGLQFGHMNIYHRKNRRARGSSHLFSIANLYKPGEFNPAGFDHFTTRGLTVFMNLPVTYDPPWVFDEMVKCSRVLCEQLNGRLLDRDNHALDDAALERIRHQIAKIAVDMETWGVSPGSETALRLF